MKQNCNVPAFLSKLWTLVEDPGTDDLISWSRNGTCFQVSNERRFAKEILPMYFKHNNMASFVRQLNMYGFHKVVHIGVGLPRDLDDIIEFQHPRFRQGEPQLLDHIKRKVSVSRVDDFKLRQQEVLKLLSDIRQMKGKNDLADSTILTIKRENEALWKEISTLKQKQLQQHKVIRKILHFIATMVQSNSVAGIKRKMPLMIGTSGMAPSYPKYSRPITMDSSQDGTAVHGIPKCETCEKSSVYPGGVIISEITHMIGSPELPGEEQSFVTGKLNSGETLFSTDTDNLVATSSTASSPFASHNLYDDLLDESCQTTAEENPDQSEIIDHLDMIDNSLAQIHSSLSNTRLNTNLDLLKDLFNPSTGGLITSYPEVGLDTSKKASGQKCTSVEEEQDYTDVQTKRGCVFAVQVTVKDSHLNATEGENVTLQCTYTTTENLSNLNIQWTFLGTTSQEHTQIYYSEGKQTYISKEFKGRLLAAQTPGNASITIKKLRPSDTGDYLCEVDNPPDFAGTNIRSIVLTVLVPPSKPKCGITVHPAKMNAAILSCHSDQGVPTPSYHWVENVNNVHQNISGYSDPRTGLLTISNVSQHEHGVYQCTASNNLGNETCTIDLSTLSSESDHIIGAIIGAVLAAIVIGAIVWVITKKKAKKNAGKDTEFQVKQEARRTSTTYATVPTDDASAAATTNETATQLSQVDHSRMDASEVHAHPTETPLLSENAVPSGTEKAPSEETDGVGTHAV
ncbi:heat shock factor protein 1-like isoform X4 [Stegostoma tigrinum]|uniref:heat shock factor protein 1-like isoform X4 n=1 Tax=Stegostoma tigrinum TaxID=3053191 RepID=UPI00287016FD|nr:heat shock factor protein 1-like isoform X4 [Stegostoma tigrinum]